MPIRTPILQSCCCWRSLRKGSYAVGIYTAVYFSIIIVTLSHFLYEERLYLSGNITSPQSTSFLEPESISKTTVIMNIILLACSILGFFGTILLFVGLHMNCRYLLCPWIVIMTFDTLMEVIHNGHMFILESVNFNPITAMLFTLDFFIIMIHIYSMLCVISQYQQYKLGRGLARDIQTIPVRATSTESRVGLSSAPSTHRTSDTPILTVRYTPVSFPPAMTNSMRKRAHIPGKAVSFAEEIVVENSVAALPPGVTNKNSTNSEVPQEGPVDETSATEEIEMRIRKEISV